MGYLTTVRDAKEVLEKLYKSALINLETPQR